MWENILDKPLYPTTIDSKTHVHSAALPRFPRCSNFLPSPFSFSPSLYKDPPSFLEGLASRSSVSLPDRASSVHSLALPEASHLGVHSLALFLLHLNNQAAQDLRDLQDLKDRRDLQAQEALMALDLNNLNLLQSLSLLPPSRLRNAQWLLLQSLLSLLLSLLL